MNRINKRAIAKLAGTLGLAGASSLLVFPAFSATPSSKVNPNPTIFSEAPYAGSVAQSSGSSATPNLDRNSTQGGTGSGAAPSGTPTNPSSAPTAEPSNIGPTQDRSNSGSSTGSSSPNAAPSGTPTNPSAAPSGSGGSGADVVVPSDGSMMQNGSSTPTPAQGGSISPAGGNPADSTTTPSSIPGTPGNMTPMSPNSTTTTPSMTPGSMTMPTMTTPDSTMTPDSTTTTPSSTPSGGSGGVRALW